MANNKADFKDLAKQTVNFDIQERERIYGKGEYVPDWLQPFKSYLDNAPQGVSGG